MSRPYVKIFVLLSLPLQVLLVQVLAGRPLLVEQFYSLQFYQILSGMLRLLVGWVPVPVGQFVFYGLVLALVLVAGREVWRLLRRQVGGKLFLRRSGFALVAFLSGFYFLFHLMWGLNYHRRPIHEIVGLEPRDLSATELETLCLRLIHLSHQSRLRVTRDQSQALQLSMSQDQLLQQARQGYEAAARQFPELRYRQPAVKAVLVPELMSSFGIGGIYFPFTGEANVNMDPPAFALPEVICHEMAHQVGIASEDEANYVAFLTCRLNPDPAFQYSGHLMAMRYAMNRLSWVKPAAFEKLKKTLQPGLRHDLEAQRRYWESFDNPVEIVGKAIHDLFLKANDQEEGLVSYSRVVELVMGEYRKNGLPLPPVQPRP
ncbi:MAG: DUF3810 domain-containing protein [Adhaeribacter sp.]